MLQVAPSSYYEVNARQRRAPSARAQRDAVLGPVVKQLWEDNYRVYGARKIWKAARRVGHDVGRDQVARLMRTAGIEGVRRTKLVRTTRPEPGVPRHPDLVGRDFTATAPNQLWVTDLTFVLGEPQPESAPVLGVGFARDQACLLQGGDLSADGRGIQMEVRCQVTGPQRAGVMEPREDPVGGPLHDLLARATAQVHFLGTTDQQRQLLLDALHRDAVGPRPH